MGWSLETIQLTPQLQRTMLRPVWCVQHLEMPEEFPEYVRGGVPVRPQVGLLSRGSHPFPCVRLEADLPYIYY
jgi:hypothetical protein